MTMYVRTVVPMTITVSSQDYEDDIVIDSRSPYKVLPLWAAQRPEFQELWDEGKVEVATDTDFEDIITSIPASELGDAVSSVAGLSGEISASSLRTALSVNNVDNTSDATKNAASVTLSNKTIASPTLTGTTAIAQSGAVELYNTADQTTNFERASFRYNSNVLEMGLFHGGTGNARSIRLGVTTAAGATAMSTGRHIFVSGIPPFISQEWISTGGGPNLTGVGLSSSLTGSSGIQNTFCISPTVQQSGTASYTMLLINPTETATGSGTKRLIDAQVGGNSRFSVDNTGLATANSYVSTKTSTATAAGTTTLTIASSQVQEFTGTTTHTVRLPSTGVITGQTYTIINNSTGAVTIQASGGGSIPINAQPGKIIVVMAVADTPTAASEWQVVSLTATTTFSGNPNTIAVRDGVANLSAVRFIPGFTSVATSDGSTTMSWSWSEIVVFTGASNHTVVLPSVNAVAGSRWTIINNSTGTITVNASGGATVTTLAAAAAKDFIALQATPTTAAHWTVK